MINIAKFQEKINKHYPNEKIKILRYEGARSKCVAQCLSCGQIYTYQISGGLLSKQKHIFCRKCQNKKTMLAKFQKALKDRYPFDDLEIISFSHRSEPCDIKCKRCGTVFHFQRAAYALSKTREYFCSKCYPSKMEQMQRTLDKFKHFIQVSEDWELAQSLDKVHSHTLVSCKCVHCGEINEKTVYDYLRGRGCFCQSGTKQKTTEDFKKQLDDDYELLDEYTSAFSKVKIRHKTCGFIYKVTPHNYLTGKRCPKCSRKESKGEKKIKEILEENNIKFFKEYPVLINGHRLRFDFYLPDINVYIEYQGEQHYHPIGYFGGEKRFILQQQYDKYKKDYAKNNLLVISYNDDIFAILNKALKLNDHPEKE